MQHLYALLQKCCFSKSTRKETKLWKWVMYISECIGVCMAFAHHDITEADEGTLLWSQVRRPKPCLSSCSYWSAASHHMQSLHQQAASYILDTAVWWYLPSRPCLLQVWASLFTSCNIASLWICQHTEYSFSGTWYIRSWNFAVPGKLQYKF